MTNELIEVSLVVPMHNEEENIAHFFERVESIFQQLNISYEIICVNDGSKDKTLQLLVEHHQRNQHIKVVDLSRNFGKEIALSAGLDHCNGATVVPIDADLQDPPELIPEMLEKWREGFDVVYATRKIRKGETITKRATAGIFYKMLNKVSEIDIPANTGDFRLMDKKVVDALKKLPEKNRFMKGLFAWVGFKSTAIYYDRDPRYAGNTSWNYFKLWRLAIEGITSFSALPLVIWAYVGAFLSFGAFLYASFLILRTLILGIELPGYASIMVAMLFLGGIQLLSLGIIGEYLSRVYTEVKNRPLYLVKKLHGFKES
jgi:polyisoprenyl-phosphate glycosyltransferase